MALTTDEIIYLLFLIFGTLVTSVGNAFVLIAWLIDRKIRGPQNVFIISLAFVDLLVGVIIFPSFIVETFYPTNNIYWCQIRLVAILALTTLSIFHLIAIAWDRYKIISYGVPYIQYRSSRAIIQIILAMWILSIWIAVPPLFDQSKWSRFGSTCRFNGGAAWSMHSLFGRFIFPSAILIKLYYRVYQGLKERLRKKEAARANPTCAYTEEISITSTDNNLEAEDKPEIAKKKPKRITSATLRQERKTMTVLGIVIGAFMICWFPMFVLLILQLSSVTIVPKVWRMAGYVGWTNSALNPIIYAAFNLDFRNAFLRVLTCGRKQLWR